MYNILSPFTRAPHHLEADTYQIAMFRETNAHGINPSLVEVTNTVLNYSLSYGVVHDVIPRRLVPSFT